MRQPLTKSSVRSRDAAEDLYGLCGSSLPVCARAVTAPLHLPLEVALPLPAFLHPVSSAVQLRLLANDTAPLTAPLPLVVRHRNTAQRMAGVYGMRRSTLHGGSVDGGAPRVLASAVHGRAAA